ncbi:MAG: hypothetical protein RIA69_01295, partial [Cyclobacteriaceae bacterium]
MLTTFQKTKLSYLFNILGKNNNNNELQLSDIITIGNEVVDLLKFEDEKDEKKYRDLIKRKSTSFFNRLTSDIPVENKGIVTLSEWLQFFDSEIVHGQDTIITDEFVDLILMFLFGFYNQNRDGYMTMDEYIGMFSILGLSKTDLTAAFKLFDANKDG